MGSEDQKVEAPERRPLGTNIASLVRDLARMADLQLQLMSLDLKQFWSSARTSLTVSMLAAIAILASLPVLLLGVAGMLERFTGWGPDACRLLLGAGVAGAASILLWLAVVRVGRSAATLKRSQEELAQNLKWVREVLHQDD